MDSLSQAPPTHPLTFSLAHTSLKHSILQSHTYHVSLVHSLTHPTAHLLPHAHTHSLAHSLHTHSHTHSLPPSNSGITWIMYLKLDLPSVAAYHSDSRDCQQDYHQPHPYHGHVFWICPDPVCYHLRCNFCKQQTRPNEIGWTAKHTHTHKNHAFNRKFRRDGTILLLCFVTCVATPPHPTPPSPPHTLFVCSFVSSFLMLI